MLGELGEEERLDIEEEVCVVLSRRAGAQGVKFSSAPTAH